VVSGVVSGLQHVHSCSLRTVFGESVGDGVKSKSSDFDQRSGSMLAEGRLVGIGVGSIEIMECGIRSPLFSSKKDENDCVTPLLDAMSTDINIEKQTACMMASKRKENNG